MTVYLLEFDGKILVFSSQKKVSEHFKKMFPADLWEFDFYKVTENETEFQFTDDGGKSYKTFSVTEKPVL